MELDKAKSTVKIHCKTYPAVYLICPQTEGKKQTELERSFGATSGDKSVYIPAENGVIFQIEPWDDGENLTFGMFAHHCELLIPEEKPEDQDWVPVRVSLTKLGSLIAGWDEIWEWTDAEPQWVEETIDRFSYKRFIQPTGPKVKLVRLDYFSEDEPAT